MAKKLSVGAEMSDRPVAVDDDLLARDVLELMRMHGFRHFPVLKGEDIVGVVSERDLLSSSHREGWKDLSVREVMTKNPYRVKSDTPLAEVASALAENKYGCVVVEDRAGGLMGIFTVVDGMRVLAEILRHPPRDGKVIPIGDFTKKMELAMLG